MSKQPMLTNYVSEIDQFLQKFDKEHSQLSRSQKQEIEKYRRVYYLRDVVDRPDELLKLWEGF